MALIKICVRIICVKKLIKIIWDVKKNCVSYIEFYKKNILKKCSKIKKSSENDEWNL